MMWKTHPEHENPPQAALSSCTWPLLSQHELNSVRGTFACSVGDFCCFFEKSFCWLRSFWDAPAAHRKRQNNDVARMHSLSRWKVFFCCTLKKKGMCRAAVFLVNHWLPLTDSPRELANQVFTCRKCHQASAEFTQKQMRQLQIKSAHNGWSLSTLKNKLV